MPCTFAVIAVLLKVGICLVTCMISYCQSGVSAQAAANTYSAVVQA